MALMTPEEFVGDSIRGEEEEKRREEKGGQGRRKKDRILVGVLTPEAGVWVDEDTIDVESSQSSQLATGSGLWTYPQHTLLVLPSFSAARYCSSPTLKRS